MSERLRVQGIDPGTPAQLAAYIKSELARLEKLIKTIGLKSELAK